jgi:hypothetical protein
MSVDITPVEIDGQFGINMSMDGHEMNRSGPYAIDEAKATIERLAGVCRVLCQAVRVTKELRR